MDASPPSARLDRARHPHLLALRLRGQAVRAGGWQDTKYVLSFRKRAELQRWAQALRTPGSTQWEPKSRGDGKRGRISLGDWAGGGSAGGRVYVLRECGGSPRRVDVLAELAACEDVQQGGHWQCAAALRPPPRPPHRVMLDASAP